VPDKLGAVGLEIPMREIGGQRATWEELDAIKAHCKPRRPPAHGWRAAVGGAGRLWTQRCRDRSGLRFGLRVAVQGHRRSGSRAFVERAAEWFRRQGGNLIHRSPYLLTAAMQFDARLAALPDYFRRTRFLYEALRAHPEIRVNPAHPAANMLHLHLPVDRQRALQVRTELAERYGIWMYNSVSHQVLPDTSYVELYIGDNLLSVPHDGVRDTWRFLPGR
jgi:hypothetical protein